eukprot:c18207_g1_i1 orf=145-615(+)
MEMASLLPSPLRLSPPTPPSPPPLCGLPTRPLPFFSPSPLLRMVSTRQSRFHSCCSQPSEQGYVTYDDEKSVFPAEACEELGGDSCEIDGVGQEVKPKATASREPIASPLAGKDREYVEYTGEKTVFPGEACEELGGEFCQPEYQKGVYPDKVSAT